jgi:hypothetical protein
MIISTEIKKFVKRYTGLDNVKFLPQNVKKSSKPAALVRKYGNSDPNKIVWLYHKDKRYVGVMIEKNFILNNEVLKWVLGRSSQCKHVFVGNNSVMLIFKEN